MVTEIIRIGQKEVLFVQRNEGVRFAMPIPEFKVIPDRYADWVILWIEVHKLEGVTKTIEDAKQAYYESYKDTEHVIIEE